MNVGIFAIDPGEYTGLAWVIVNPHERLAADVLKNSLRKGSITIQGDPMEQARKIWNLWSKFKTEAVSVSLLPADNIYLVCEDFRLVPNATPGKRTTAPERVAWAFEGYRNGRHDTYRQLRHFSNVIWQDPGAAHRFNDRNLLGPAGCWISGKQHERSAFAHVYLYIARLLDRQPIRA
jgi:hypothetical protein